MERFDLDKEVLKDISLVANGMGLEDDDFTVEGHAQQDSGTEFVIVPSDDLPRAS